jgi:hypothetical protein
VHLKTVAGNKCVDIVCVLVWQLFWQLNISHNKNVDSVIFIAVVSYVSTELVY